MYRVYTSVSISVTGGKCKRDQARDITYYIWVKFSCLHTLSFNLIYTYILNNKQKSCFGKVLANFVTKLKMVQKWKQQTLSWTIIWAESEHFLV